MAAPVCPLAVTELIPTEDFHLTGVLGQGGNGIVYAARHRGCDVALKVLREDFVLSERERNRFLDEAHRMRRVEHEGLIRLLASGVLSDGRPYLCMPRLRGETLASRLGRGALALEEALVVFDTLAEAVAVLHRAGLIHRDIKPENIFLEEHRDAPAAPHPVLLDFGIARDVTESESTTTAAGQTRGTPAYMAPERFFGSVANVRTDVYELAVTLYCMLTARLPWDDVQSAATRLSPIHPADAGARLPVELATVILQALSTRPEMRPDCADSLADLVRRAASSAPHESGRTTAALDVRAVPVLNAAPSVAPLAIDSPQHGRRGALWGVGAGVAGLLAVLGLAAASFPHRPTELPGSMAMAPATNSSRAEAPPVAPSPPEIAPPVATGNERSAAGKPSVPPVTTPAPDPSEVLSKTSNAARPRRPTVPVVVAQPPASATSTAESADRYYRDRK
jgi:eukaryotic-like serine/threonine-protein kinase